VSESVNELAKLDGISTTLMAQGQPGAFNVIPTDARVRTMIVSSTSTMLMASGLSFRAQLRALMQKTPVSLVHNHGTWLPVNHFASRAARAFNKPIIIQPHGMLEPWSLDHRLAKKRLAMWAYQGNDLRRATAFVATADSECESIRKLGLKQPVAIIPNGVSMDGLTHPRASRDPARPKRIALFLSRVHPKKGIPDLLRAWAQVGRSDWLLQIVGPEEIGHLKECRDLARTLAIEDHVHFLGEVYGAEKSRLYQDADLFVLPTYSENFGIVVAEALSFGLPVITTKGTPWCDLETHQCGWWIDCGVDPLTRTLLAAFDMDDETRLEMGSRGRQYVQQYTWERNAALTAHFYRWILNRVDPGDFIRTS
jgi:glycosyltransferase involved in cell wall biosynthesis